MYQFSLIFDETRDDMLFYIMILFLDLNFVYYLFFFDFL